ncbi:hypothetical protein CAL22_02660 [Bordetella genomosp. 12]|uniref:Uncharacterized protein n=1 Tax=Bordetella genomosp. 12 TaxID=463035 RepID=A0A261VUL1_9BORD|nr:hypothetical protein CAL22_02660 [Bordetella genomosp. 12]
MHIGLAGRGRRGQMPGARPQGACGLPERLQGSAVRPDQADLAARQARAAFGGQQRLEQALGQPFGRQKMQQPAARAQLGIEHTP